MMLSLIKKLPRLMPVNLAYGLALLCLALIATLLAGCAGKLNSENTQIKLPEKQLTDFMLTSCPDIWQVQGREITNNPLYWLRLIDCSHSLTGQQDYQQVTDWQQAFKQGIMLAQMKSSPAQYRQFLKQLGELSVEMPAVVWPLFQLWRDEQSKQLDLIQERANYRKLQQATDNELDSLRRQLQVSQKQLEETVRKLESLTDIERQLSTRKASEGYIQPGSRTPDTENRPARAKPQSKDHPVSGQEEAKP